MQFKVPQFLDIEDKIFGPFTFSEFIYLAGGAGICFFLFKLLGWGLGIVPMMFVAGFSLALTFYKPNNKPFVDMLESAITYFFGYKLYIWQRKRLTKKDKELKEKEAHPAPVHHDPRLNGGKLRDLAWSLDILDLKKENNR
jgi:hypothetical protein